MHVYICQYRADDIIVLWVSLQYDIIKKEREKIALAWRLMNALLGWIVCFILKVACFKKDCCISETCLVRRFCSKKVMSPDEKEALLHLIEEFDRAHGIYW